MDAFDVQNALTAALDVAAPDAFESIDIEDYPNDVRSFEDCGVLTSDAGLVLRMTDGTEFQVTIVQSA